MEKKLKGRFTKKTSKDKARHIQDRKKIIRQQENKSLVKWFAYNDSFNSWVDNKAIVGKL